VPLVELREEAVATAFSVVPRRHCVSRDGAALRRGGEGEKQWTEEDCASGAVGTDRAILTSSTSATNEKKRPLAMTVGPHLLNCSHLVVCAICCGSPLKL
jgi:hypothetical protein